ncbi:MAG TPA: DUF4252 domain-containing protein, partial [Sunxiuqinia sp.]|nr:DUF4252 domain-containing protein [Sunxiuqinia sp.]
PTIFKLILVVSLIFAETDLFAQSKSDRLFDTFQNKPGVTYFAFTKNMNDAFNIDLDEGQTISGDLQEIRFLSYNPHKGSLTGNDFMHKAVGLLPHSYKQLLAVDDDSDAEIWMLGNKRKAKEFHVFVHNKSSQDLQFVVSFYGDFDIKKDMDGIREISMSMSKEE